MQAHQASGPGRHSQIPMKTCGSSVVGCALDSWTYSSENGFVGHRRES